MLPKRQYFDNLRSEKKKGKSNFNKANYENNLLKNQLWLFLYSVANVRVDMKNQLFYTKAAKWAPGDLFVHPRCVLLLFQQISETSAMDLNYP